MKIPVRLPARSSPSVPGTATRPVPVGGVAQAGCCAQVCAPIIGCHCVAESPFC